MHKSTIIPTFGLVIVHGPATNGLGLVQEFGQECQ